jgi:hypothetical protein
MSTTQDDLNITVVGPDDAPLTGSTPMSIPVGMGYNSKSMDANFDLFSYSDQPDLAYAHHHDGNSSGGRLSHLDMLFAVLIQLLFRLFHAHNAQLRPRPEPKHPRHAIRACGLSTAW